MFSALKDLSILSFCYHVRPPQVRAKMQGCRIAKKTANELAYCIILMYQRKINLVSRKV